MIPLVIAKSKAKSLREKRETRSLFVQGNDHPGIHPGISRKNSRQFQFINSHLNRYSTPTIWDVSHVQPEIKKNESQKSISRSKTHLGELDPGYTFSSFDSFIATDKLKPEEEKLAIDTESWENAYILSRKYAADNDDVNSGESESETFNFRTYVVLPTWWQYRIWEIIILLFVTYNSIYLPISLVSWNSSDNEDTSDSYNMLQNIDSTSDVFYWADLILNFFVAYIDDYGTLITDRRKIAEQYLRFWFWLDLSACLPWHIFLPADYVTAGNMIKCIRLLRISKIIRYLEKYNFGRSIKISQSFFTLMLGAHWLACGWYYVGVNAEVDCTLIPNGIWSESSWSVVDNNSSETPSQFCSWIALNDLNREGVSAGTVYIKSLHWSLASIASVGYGDLKPVTPTETIYAVIAIIFGAALYVTVCSSLVRMFSLSDITAFNYGEIMEDVKEQMKMLKFPDVLENKVLVYYDYVFFRHKGLLNRGMYFFEELPQPLRQTCTKFLYNDLLKEAELFSGVSDSFLRELCTCFVITIAIPNEIIIYEGDHSNALYAIQSGSCIVYRGSVEDETYQHIVQLGPGDIFGEIGLLTGKHRTASVRAKSFTDLQYIEIRLFYGLLKYFRKDHEVIVSNCIKFLKSEG